MERDATQSMLDEKFPAGANVYLRSADAAFNTARFMVMSDEQISCGPYNMEREVIFFPKDVVEQEDGTVVFTEAYGDQDVIVRPAPDIPELLVQREKVYTDQLLADLRGESS